MLKRSFFFAIALAAFVLTGCGPHWVVIRQVVPNPMGPTSPFFVRGVTLDGMRIGDTTEAEWMSQKDSSTRESWANDKVGMADEFGHGFDQGGEGLVRAASPAGAFTVIAHYVHYEPGFYAVVAARPGQIDAVIDIIDPNGTPLDQFMTTAVCGGFSQGQHARECSRIIGINAAKYVLSRIGK
jgi:hypothetical protein